MSAPETPRTEYCPFCGERLSRDPASRFVECERHGRLIVNASRVEVDR